MALWEWFSQITDFISVNLLNQPNSNRCCFDPLWFWMKLSHHIMGKLFFSTWTTYLRTYSVSLSHQLQHVKKTSSMVLQGPVDTQERLACRNLQRDISCAAALNPETLIVPSPGRAQHGTWKVTWEGKFCRLTKIWRYPHIVAGCVYFSLWGQWN